MLSRRYRATSAFAWVAAPTLLDTPLASEIQSHLPAVRYDPRGRRHVDYRAVIALAGPLFVNSALQAVLSLTDTWFIGRLSVDEIGRAHV